MPNIQIIANNIQKQKFSTHPPFDTLFYTVILTKTLKGQYSGFPRAYIKHVWYVES